MFDLLRLGKECPKLERPLISFVLVQNIYKKKETAHHVITRKQLLQKLSLFMLHCFNNELIVAGDVEPGTAGTWVAQLN